MPECLLPFTRGEKARLGRLLDPYATIPWLERYWLAGRDQPPGPPAVRPRTKSDQE
jgi:hypothetical protein